MCATHTMSGNIDSIWINVRALFELADSGNDIIHFVIEHRKTAFTVVLTSHQRNHHLKARLIKRPGHIKVFGVKGKATMQEHNGR